MFRHSLSPLLVALVLFVLQLRSGTDAYIVPVLALALLSCVTIAGGYLILRATGEENVSPSAAWALGLLATSLTTYALTILVPVTAAIAWILVAAAVIVAGILARKRLRATAPDRHALAGFALCVAFTAAWCWEPAAAYDVLRARDVLPVWGDNFVHGALISQFGDVRVLGRGSIFLADFPSSFYHFASYLPAAALAGLLDQPGLPLATSAWLPLGFLVMTCGALALGERLGGAAGGIAALGVVALLPDASSYGLRNGFLSFYWSAMAHPGSTYALGAAFLSLAFLDRWSRDRSASAFIASVGLAASMLFLRAHVFLLFMPAWIATAAYCGTRRNHGPRRIGLWLAAALAVVGGFTNLFLTYLAEADPSAVWHFRGPALTRFLEILHSGHEPTGYTGLYAELVSWYPWWFSLAAGILLAYLAALGAFVVLLPTAAVLARRYGTLRPIDVFPLAVAFVWLLFMLLAPLTWAVEGPEIIDRPVVLLYASTAIWAFCLALRTLTARAAPLAERTWLALLGAAIVAWPATFAAADGMARPKFTGGLPHLALRAEPGLIEAAAFLRRQARVGDIFAASGLSADFAVVDLPVKLCALSGMPAYLARPHLEMIKDSRRREIATARLAVLREIDRQDQYGEARRLLLRAGIEWYVVAGAQGPRWDPYRERAKFTAGTISLYSTSEPKTM